MVKPTIKRTLKKEKICSKEMSFEECEMAILRISVDESEKRKGKLLAKNEIITDIIQIVEQFIKQKKLICYGGTAINNILPKYDQFYDKEVEIPDYDFFSTDALNDAKELADIYYKKGYNEIEAKAGVHKGTYKVFVNFIPVADITLLHPVLFKEIKREAIKIDGIQYAPPNYLRMAMYLELSRPDGDTSRWEKVLKRINLLNKHYPLLDDVSSEECNTVDFQRSLETHQNDMEKIYFIVRDTFIKESCIFIGGFASTLYSRYMNTPKGHRLKHIPDFDVLSDEPEKVAFSVKENLEKGGFKKVKIYYHHSIGEIIPEHYEITIGKDTLGFVYSPISCHAYNVVHIDKKPIRVASIDTLLSFYLAFIYANKPYFDKERILCMSHYLFEVQQHNRLKQSGLLKRFSLDCYGHQETLDAIRVHKAKMFNQLKKGSKEYEEWFLKYNPSIHSKIKRKKIASLSEENKTHDNKKNKPNITYELKELDEDEEDDNDNDNDNDNHETKDDKEKSEVDETTQKDTTKSSRTKINTRKNNTQTSSKTVKHRKGRTAFLY